MKFSKLAAAIGAMALLSTTAYAGDVQPVQPFSALQGVEAQALSSPEMSSVYGQLWTTTSLQAAIDTKLAPYPTLDARVDTAIAAHPVLFQAIVNVLNKH